MMERRNGNLERRGIYVILFSDNSVYIGLSYNPKSRFAQHLKLKTIVGKKLRDHTLTHEFFFDGVFLNVQNAKEEEKKRIQFYKNQGRNVLNISKGGEVGGPIQKWTLDHLQAEANKYSQRQNFKNNSPIAYELACRRKVLKKISEHMEKNDNKEAGYWTVENLFAEMSKYKRSCDFKKNSSGAYWSATNQKIDIRAFYGPRIGNTKYSFEQVYESASKFKKINDWRNEFPNHYKSAYRRGWHKKIVAELFKG